MKSKYEALSYFFAILSNPTRLLILDALVSNCIKSNSKEGCCVYEINNKIDLPQPYISKHLKVLRQAGFLTFKREGNKIYYSFSVKGLKSFKQILHFLSKFEINCC